MNKNLIWIVGVLIVILLGASYWQSTQKPKDLSGGAIRIGAILPFTGPAAYYAEQSKKGIELALEDLKTEYPETTVSMAYEDNAFNAKAGLDAYQKIKNAGRVDAVIVGTSPVGAALKPVAESDGILLMGVHVTTDAYSSPNDLSFRTSLSARFETPTVAEYLKTSSVKKLGIIYLNNDFGVSVKDSLKKDLVNAGANIEIVGEEGFLVTATDYRTQLLKLKGANPDMVFIAGTAPQISKILVQSKEQSLGLAFLSTRATEDPVLLKTGGDAVNGLIYSYSYNPDKESGFVKRYTQKYGTLPDAYAAEGYEAARLSVLAVRKCGATNRTCIQDYLSGLKEEDSAFGTLSFDENGDVRYPLFMKTIKDGQFVKLEQ